MFRNRVFLALGVLSLLLVTMAVSRPFLNAPLAAEPASDFYQRHPDWTWTSPEVDAAIPVTGDSTYLDYAQRHPELSAPAKISIDSTDYSFRHPELSAPAQTIDYSDYFARHPELGGQ